MIGIQNVDDITFSQQRLPLLYDDDLHKVDRDVTLYYFIACNTQRPLAGDVASKNVDLQQIHANNAFACMGEKNARMAIASKQLSAMR